ncbi:response regulator transcription factor [Halotalea alkalilenta]|uniref:DNA-binding response regulator n=1 Tax=Halotalea alkalilenta TaxID=376489 RepID=A0A172YIW4_9GAMM|nr:response regulator transcription factor [Halotalea alkalilenta]ANF59126.1 hypothetical protein A5892_18020 [Halotalea alkalilenta]
MKSLPASRDAVGKLPQRVLVIDDHPAIRMGYRGVLAGLGFEVEEAGDGGEGLRLCREHHYHLVLLDLDIPGLGGMEFIRRLRYRDDRTPILVISGMSADVYGPRVAQMGAQGFLSKRESLLGLERAVLRVLNTIVVQPFEGEGPRSAEMPMDEASAADLETNEEELADEPLARLTDREMMVYTLLRQGRRNKDVAEQLCLSEKTVSTYKQRLLAKLGVSSLLELEKLLQK